MESSTTGHLIKRSKECPSIRKRGEECQGQLYSEQLRTEMARIHQERLNKEVTACSYDWKLLHRVFRGTKYSTQQPCRTSKMCWTRVGRCGRVHIFMSSRTAHINESIGSAAGGRQKGSRGSHIGPRLTFCLSEQEEAWTEASLSVPSPNKPDFILQVALSVLAPSVIYYERCMFKCSGWMFSRHSNSRHHKLPCVQPRPGEGSISSDIKATPGTS